MDLGGMKCSCLKRFEHNSAVMLINEKKIQKGLESGRQRDALSLCLASGARQEEAWKMSV